MKNTATSKIEGAATTATIMGPPADTTSPLHSGGLNLLACPASGDTRLSMKPVLNQERNKSVSAATTAPFEIPPRILAAPIEPETIRLPRSGQHDPYFGLTRSCINSLVLATAENNFKPLVRSFVLRRRGAKKGVRLVDFQSLKDYILAHVETGEIGGQS